MRSHLAPVMALVAVLALAAGACQQPAAAPAPPAGAAASAPQAPGPKPSGWDQLVEAARKEGKVAVYGPPGVEYRAALVDGFQQAYPGITVDAIFINPTERLSRLAAERTAGRYLADLWVAGTNPAVTEVKQAGYSAPLKPALVLPEVLDESAWLGNHLWWADSAEPYTNLIFQGSVQTFVAINTRLVDPNQFSSYWDLLDPRWKGKIVANDIRRPGPGGVPTRFIYKQPDLGPEFLSRLFGEMDVTLSSDPRQIVDWLAEGRYPIALFMSSRGVLVAAEQGLPVGVVPADRFKEHAPLGLGNGSVVLLDRAPHPSAAQLFVNWLLSREGQLVWQRAVHEPSLRTDIPKDGINPIYLPKPGVEYVNAGTEEYARITGEAIAGLVTQALEQRPR